MRGRLKKKFGSLKYKKEIVLRHFVKKYDNMVWHMVIKYDSLLLKSWPQVVATVFAPRWEHGYAYPWGNNHDRLLRDRTAPYIVHYNKPPNRGIYWIEEKVSGV